MDNDKFSENAKEQLEREIEELKRQKEIRDLQKQKEELEKTIFGSVGGNKTEKISEQPEETDEKEETVEEKYISNKMTTILAAVVAVAIVVIGSGIFYLRNQSKKKKERLKKEMTVVSQNQDIPTVITESQTTQTTPKSTEQPKTEVKKEKEVPKSTEKLVVKDPIIVKKGSYCVGANPSESAFDTSTVEDPHSQHGYMADISFKDCVINNGTSVRHTGPVVVTVSLAEEKNYKAVINRNKWYLENGQIRRIDESDGSALYFDGWLMYKQSN